MGQPSIKHYDAGKPSTTESVLVRVAKLQAQLGSLVYETIQIGPYDTAIARRVAQVIADADELLHFLGHPSVVGAAMQRGYDKGYDKATDDTWLKVIEQQNAA